MHPILIRWPGGDVAAYSVLVCLGYVASLLWLRFQLDYHRVAPTEIWGLFATVIAGALLGGKIGFFIVARARFMKNPLAMLRFWNTGWVFWSGLLLGMLAGLGYQWWHNRHYRPRAYLPVADDCVAALAIGHAIGRLGCFMEGCCYGKPTLLPWGVSFTNAACSVATQLRGMPLHPTQLYESAGEALAAWFLIGWLIPNIRAGKYRYGTAFFGYLLYYSTMRFLIEFLRGDDRGVFLSPVLSPSQWASLIAGLAAASTLWKRGVIERGLAQRSLFTD